MPFFGTFLVFGLIQGVVSDCAFSTCETCAAASNGCGWCLQDNKCSQISDCKSDIFLQNDAYNCPRSPNPQFAFTDEFGRNLVLPLAAAAYGKSPESCLSKTLVSTRFYQNSYVPCDTYNKSDFCYSYTAYDLTRKMVVIAFRGTDGNFETVAEILGVLKKKDSFLDIGHVFDYFYNGFFYLWRAGLGDQVAVLRRFYPAFDVVIVGHSLGASMASLCASYLVKQGIVPASQIKLATFGQPRTGDIQYAAWHDANIPFSYRIVHRKDPIPHIPLQEMDLMHHRFEIWYNNDMTTKDFAICPYGDLGGQCANRQIMWQFDDHTHYYNTALSDWGKSDCA